MGPHVHWTHLGVYAQEWYARENFRELLVRNLSELVQAAVYAPGGEIDFTVYAPGGEIDFTVYFQRGGVKQELRLVELLVYT